MNTQPGRPAEAQPATLTRFRKLVILDRLILLDRQWQELRALADEVIEYAGVDPQDVAQRLEAQAGQDDGPVCWTQLAREEMTTAQLNERLAGADAVVTCWTNIPDQVLLANPQLRYVGFWTNLIDHRINRELCRERSVHVTYIPDYGTDSVAEMTMAGLLAVSRRLLDNVHDTKRGTWPYELLKTGKRVPTIDAIPQRSLHGKRLGLLGFGRIGQRVAELATAFRMEVAYWSRTRRQHWEARHVTFHEIDELFRWADVVSVHLAPYAPARIVSAERLATLRDGGILVNTSAGRLVDQEALWSELTAGRLNAYLDVYESLPPRKAISDLAGRTNVFTYRAGWFTQEAVTYKGDQLVGHLREYLAV